MRIRLLTVTHRTPAWLQTAYLDYIKRLPPHFFELVEIPAAKRLPKMDMGKLVKKEGEKLLDAIKPQHHIVALTVEGTSWTSLDLAEKLKKWRQSSRSVDFLVGGPDGLAAACLERSHEKWSLSSLTFPHTFIRLLVIEQLYRAYSILHKLPYHR